MRKAFGKCSKDDFMCVRKFPFQIKSDKTAVAESTYTLLMLPFQILDQHQLHELYYKYKV